MTTSQSHPADHAPLDDAQTRFLNRGTGRIAYDVRGTGPLVLAVPGMGDLRATYRHLAPALVDAGFRVATMDLRGHGDSDVTFDAFDDEALASDIRALIAHLGGSAVVVGNSMGAGAAVVAAAQDRAAITGLVLIGPFVRNVPQPLLLRWFFRASMAGPWAGMVWRSYLPKMFPARRGQEFDEHRAAIARSQREPGRRAAFSATARTSHDPADAVLDTVTAPTLVVMGTADPDFPDPAAEAAGICERLGQQRLLMVPEAGHYPHAEFPELTTPAVVGFVREITGA